MEALDNPKEFVFSRGVPKPPQSEVFAAWHSVLTGPAQVNYMRGKWAPKATAVSAKSRESGFKVGVTKGGKPITEGS